jgi:prepilin-type N-terminal cleavage/methylation domain-containing protein
MHSKDQGYSLIELLFVVLIASVLASAVAINMTPALVSLSIDQTASHLTAAIAKVKREALKGRFDPGLSEDRGVGEFKIIRALPPGTRGIDLTEIAPAASNNCKGECAPDEQILCLSGIPFCYKQGGNFTFESSSGRLSSSRALFLIGRRKLAILISRSGKTEIAELINGEWRARTELRNIQPPAGR